MNDISIVKLLATPLAPYFGLLLIFVGSYSLIINGKQATKQNYLRAARFARIAGWCYIIGGVAILVMQ